MSTLRTVFSHAVALTLVVVTAHASGLPEESRAPAAESAFRDLSLTLSPSSSASATGGTRG